MCFTCSPPPSSHPSPRTQKTWPSGCVLRVRHLPHPALPLKHEKHARLSMFYVFATSLTLPFPSNMKSMPVWAFFLCFVLYHIPFPHLPPGLVSPLTRTHQTCTRRLQVQVWRVRVQVELEIPRGYPCHSLDILDVLKNFVEKLLIAKIRHNRCLVKVSSGRLKMIANVVMYENPSMTLPPPIENLDEALTFLFIACSPPTIEDF